MNVQQRNKKVIMLEVKLKSSTNEVIEEKANPGNVDTAAIWEILEMQPEELSKGKIIDINVESCCDEKDEYIPEVKPAKTYILKEILKISENM